MIQYLFESAVALLSFYLLYHICLRKETFFQLNRLYLLLMPLLALSIPLLNIDVRSTQEVSDLDPWYPVVYQYQQLEQQVWGGLQEGEGAIWQLSIGDVLYWVYWIGVTIMLFRLVSGLSQLMWRIKCAKQERKAGVTYLDTAHKWPAASFFGYVFWQSKSEDDKARLILEHELVHVRQWHSLDVLLMELWVIIKWFNPIIYWYRYHLRLTHEFIADQYVVTQRGDRMGYAELMLAADNPSSPVTLANQFNSLTKMRLLMLAKTESRYWKKWKYLLSLPTAALLFSLFSFNLATELPSEIREPFEMAELMIEKAVQQEVMSWDITAERPIVQLKWGEQICECKPEKYKNLFKCDNLSFTPRAYKRFLRKSGDFELFTKGVPMPINDLKIRSNRMVDMGGFMGQFDESGEIQTESLLWKKPAFGDVYKFEFKGGPESWFSFEVVINNRKEELEPEYTADLGSYSFAVDMTNKIGVRHFNFVDFQRAMQHPFQLKGSDGKPISIDRMEVRNIAAMRKEILENLGSSTIDLKSLKVIQDVIAGDNVNINLSTSEGEEVRLDFMLRRNASSQVFNREVFLKWGEEKFSIQPFSKLALREAEMKTFIDETISLVINGEPSPIVQARIPNHPRFNNGKIEKVQGRENLSLADLQGEIAKIEPGQGLSFHAQTAAGHTFSVNLFLELPIDWAQLLGKEAQYQIQEYSEIVTIEKVSEEILTALSQLKYHNWAGPGFTIGGKEGMQSPLKELPTRVKADQIDRLKIFPPSTMNDELYGRRYFGLVVVYLK